MYTNKLIKNILQEDVVGNKYIVGDGINFDTFIPAIIEKAGQTYDAQQDAELIDAWKVALNAALRAKENSKNNYIRGSDPRYILQLNINAYIDEKRVLSIINNAENKEKINLAIEALKKSVYVIDEDFVWKKLPINLNYIYNVADASWDHNIFTGNIMQDKKESWADLICEVNNKNNINTVEVKTGRQVNSFKSSHNADLVLYHNLAYRRSFNVYYKNPFDDKNFALNSEDYLMLYDNGLSGQPIVLKADFDSKFRNIKLLADKDALPAWYLTKIV